MMMGAEAAKKKELAEKLHGLECLAIIHGYDGAKDGIAQVSYPESINELYKVLNYTKGEVTIAPVKKIPPPEASKPL